MLREYLLNNILEKYTYLFNQKEENTDPNGKPIQPWIQTMLNEMQKNIDAHINNALGDTNK